MSNQYETYQELTESLDWLKDFADKISKQDNLHTQHPIFEVREKIRVYGTALQQPDGSIFVDSTDPERSFETWKEVREHCDENEESEGDFEEVYYQEVDRTVAYFFTREEAQAHIDSNSYHFNKPFIYVESAWRNWQMQRLIENIFVITHKELPDFWR